MIYPEKVVFSAENEMLHAFGLPEYDRPESVFSSTYADFGPGTSVHVSGTTVTCNLGTLTSGSTLNGTVDIKAAEEGSLDSSGSVTSA